MNCPRCGAECRPGAASCAVCGCNFDAARTTSITEYGSTQITQNQQNVGAGAQQPMPTVINFGSAPQPPAQQAQKKKGIPAFFAILLVLLLMLASYYIGIDDTFKMTGCINKIKKETPVGTWVVDQWDVDEFITDKLATGTVVTQMLGSFEDTISNVIEAKLTNELSSTIESIPGLGSFVNGDDIADNIVDELNIPSYFEGLDEMLINFAGVTYETTDVTESYVASDSDVIGKKADISEDGVIMGIDSYYAVKGAMEYEYDGHGTLILYVGGSKSSVAIVIRCTFDGDTMTWTANGETIAEFTKAA